MPQNNDLNTALTRLGFEAEGRLYFGRWQGYAVSLVPMGAQCQVSLATHADKKYDKLRRNVLKSAARLAPRKCQVVNAGNAFVFSMPCGKKVLDAGELPRYLDAFAEALRENNFLPSETCSVCGGQRPDSLCFIGSYQPVHRSCVRSLEEKTREETEQNQLNGSYLTGTVGAVLGMIVGLIPNVFVGVATERIYALLFALVPLAAMWCYRKFNGKMSKGSIGIIIAVSLLGVFVMQYFTLAIYVMKDYGVSLGTALSYTGELFGDREIFGEIMGKSISHFLFMGLGILFAWRYLNQTNGGKLANMKSALATMRDNPDFAPEKPDETPWP